jgi:hypothetical protein
MQVSGPLYIKWTPPYTNVKTYTNSTTTSTLISDGYINTGFTVCKNYGYQNKCNNTWGRLPLYTSGSASPNNVGSSSTYNCDYYYYGDGTKLSIVGGSSYNGAGCGSWYVFLDYDAAASDWCVGGSALLK